MKENIQAVIRERVTVEKDTVVEEERIKDTRAMLTLNVLRSLLLKAEEEAEKERVIS